MWELSESATKAQVITEIARILHCDDYLELWGSIPVNLEVQLHEDELEPGVGGTGTFTVSVPTVAMRFLKEHEGDSPFKTVQFAQRRVFFKPSVHCPRADLVEKLLHTPYIDPQAEAEKRKRIAEAEANKIPICGIEFGWECRDAVFSCEWEQSLDPTGTLGYDEGRREFRIGFGSKSIALRPAQINWASCGMDGPLPVICFNLESNPIFEEMIPQPDPDLIQAPSNIPQPPTFTRTRISSLGPGHDRVAAYTSLAARFICISQRALEMFRTLCRISPLGPPLGEIYQKEYRKLFSAELMHTFELWLAQLDFELAFQVERIVRDARADFQEILTLREAIGDLVRLEGVKHTIGVLRSFDSALKESPRDTIPITSSPYSSRLYKGTCRKPGALPT